MLNLCSDCIWKTQGKAIPSGKCPDCGKETLISVLDGATKILSCSSCGFEIVSASYFPPCHYDEKEYTLMAKAAPKNQYVKTAKALGTNVVELKKKFDNGIHISQKKDLREVSELMMLLNALHVEYEVSPDPLIEYKELLTCKLK